MRPIVLSSPSTISPRRSTICGLPSPSGRPALANYNHSENMSKVDSSTAGSAAATALEALRACTSLVENIAYGGTCGNDGAALLHQWAHDLPRLLKDIAASASDNDTMTEFAEPFNPRRRSSTMDISIQRSSSTQGEWSVSRRSRTQTMGGPLAIVDEHDSASNHARQSKGALDQSMQTTLAAKAALAFATAGVAAASTEMGESGKENSQSIGGTHIYGMDMDALLCKPKAEHWRTTLLLKKAREAASKAKEEQDRIATEESKWIGVPAWKRKLLEDKARKAWEADAPAREAQAKEDTEAERFRALPGWKQQLIVNKLGVKT